MTKSFPLICIILLLFVVIFLLFNTKFMNENNEKISLTANLDKIINKNIEKIRKNVIFDLGANVGDSVLLFADPEFKCDSCHELKGICTKDNKKWIIYSLLQMNLTQMTLVTQ